jgi:hypothetical protein
MLTAEQKAALDAEVDEFLASHGRGTKAYRDAKARQQARPKVVVEEGRIVREAAVQVSEADPNYRQGPRPGFVVINQEVLEREWRAARAAEEWNREEAAGVSGRALVSTFIRRGGTDDGAGEG